MSLRCSLALFLLAVDGLAQLTNLTADSQSAYFVTNLRQRGSTQTSGSKVFRLSNGQLTLIDFLAPRIFEPVYFERPSVDASGKAWAVNRRISCTGGSACIFRELSQTDIAAPRGTFSFPGKASISPNGQYAAVYGTMTNSLRLVELTTGRESVVGVQAAPDGQMVSNDGTVLAGGTGGVRLIGLMKTTNLALTRPMSRALLASDAGRIVYQTRPDGTPVDEIHVFDVATGQDRLIGPGMQPSLAHDGRRFSYLIPINPGTQTLMLGDAAAGTVRFLATVSAVDQTISGDGSTVFVATYSGGLLAIDVASGTTRTLLADAGPPVSLLTSLVPGSYNEAWGAFPPGYQLDLRIGGKPVPVLGRNAQRIAFQVPWDVPVDSAAEVILASPEPAWESLITVGVAETSAWVLPLDPPQPGPQSYAAHQDWSALVTKASPARRGEVVHLFGTGYGAVDGTVVTGQPTPADRLYRLTAPCVWQAIGVLSEGSRPFEVRFAGLAPGLTGIYQFDFVIPADWPYPLFNAYCQLPNGYLTTYAVDVAP